MDPTRADAKDALGDLYHDGHCTEPHPYLDEEAATVVGRKTLVKKCYNCEAQDHHMFAPDTALDAVDVAGRTLELGQEFTLRERLGTLRGSTEGDEAYITLIQDGESVIGHADHYVFLAYREGPSAKYVRTSRLPADEFVTHLDAGAIVEAE